MSQLPLCAIIGSGPGLGLSIGQEFARKGFRIALFARRGAAAEVSALRSEGFAAEGHALDCGDPAAVHAALAALGPVQVLVYNAAAVTQAMPLALTPQQLLADFTVSVASALASVQAVAPAMPSGGSVLLTGGGFALRPMAVLTSLGIGKAGIRNLAFSLAEALRPQGIRVATVTVLGIVAPGSAFDPAAIAARFAALHDDRDESLGVESQFTGAAT